MSVCPDHSDGELPWMCQCTREKLDKSTAERDALQAKLDKCRTALEIIASFGEGAVVTSSFDDPHNATTAREALEETK